MPTAKVNGINIYYEVQGEGDPLLLIPGLGNGLSLFRHSIPVFSKARKVIALDNRGVGLSDKPDAPYTMDMMADDAVGLLRFLDIKEADVLGASMGGRIAMDLATRYPETVRRLVLVSTTARVTPESRSSSNFKFGKALKRITGGGVFPSAQPYYAFVRQLDASSGYDATALLRMIKAPTLIMRGERDSLAPKDLVDELHSGIEGSKLVECKGGHLFFLFRREEFEKGVEGFLRGAAE